MMEGTFQTSGALRGAVAGLSADKETFGATVERNERVVEQLVDVLLRIDQRISGRCEPHGVPEEKNPVSTALERVALGTARALERAVELAQRIAGDVGALG